MIGLETTEACDPSECIIPAGAPSLMRDCASPITNVPSDYSFGVCRRTSELFLSDSNTVLSAPDSRKEGMHAWLRLARVPLSSESRRQPGCQAAVATADCLDQVALKAVTFCAACVDLRCQAFRLSCRHRNSVKCCWLASLTAHVVS